MLVYCVKQHSYRRYYSISISSVRPSLRQPGQARRGRGNVPAALQRTEKALGTLTLNTVNNLRSLYKDQNKLAEAEIMFQRAMRLSEKALGVEHTLTLNIVNNLGNLYRDQSKLIKAEMMYQQAPQGYEKALGRDNTLAYTPALNTT